MTGEPRDPRTPDLMDNLPPLTPEEVDRIVRDGTDDPLLAWAVEDGIDLALGIREDLIADGHPDALAWPVPRVGGRFEQVMHAVCEEELRHLRAQG